MLENTKNLYDYRQNLFINEDISKVKPNANNK